MSERWWFWGWADEGIGSLRCRIVLAEEVGRSGCEAVCEAVCL